jgi:3-oxoadipate enol-lactonase
MSVPLHHVVEGPADAPPLLLANSLGTDTSMWSRLVARLHPDRFRIVRFDHRGQGVSDVPHGPYAISDLGEDVVALLDDLEIESTAYCGVSVGGMVGLWLGAHAPERIERLVVCNSSAYPGNPEAWLERAATVEAAASTAPVADAIVGRWLTGRFQDEHPEVLAELKAMLVTSPPDGYAALCTMLAELDLRGDLERIPAPTLVIGGAQDASLPPLEHAEPIARGIPGARFELLDPAAHLPMAERPDAVAALILEHLEASFA